MRTYLWKFCAWIIFIAIMAPTQSYAACQIVGYTTHGYIIVCDGPDTIGVISGNGNDIITINVGADVTKTDLQSVDSTATAAATTINAGRGNDQITNIGSVRTNAGLEINPSDQIITLWGSDEANASVTGNVVATGIDGGTSTRKDSVTNNGTVDVNATSKVTAGQIQFNLFDMTKVDATLKANATATGIKGKGSNEIVNNNTITVTSTASVTAWTGEENVLDQATANTTITPKATSTGIAGGDSYDKITNTGGISVTANTEAYANFLELNVIDAAVMGAGVGSLEDPMKSVATGISAGDGGSKIVNAATGRITADANSTANIASVILTLFDFTIAADISKSAGSTATYLSAISTGINGGNGGDIVINDGEISTNATSLALSESLGVGAEGVPSGILNSYKLDIPLADATITAKSEAAGISVGAGDDHIVNTGKITVDANATSLAGTLSVSFPLLELTGLNSPWIDYPPAIAVASAGTQAVATASGIQGGKGNDTISNNENPGAIIDVNATSLATTTQASVALQNVKTAGGGKPYFANLDLSLANAATKAETMATGIDGEEGNDFIENKGSLYINANSTAIGNAASVVVEGLKGMEGLGVAIVRTKVGTEGTATAIGITGGEGNDEIHNTGRLDVDANSLANSFSANVSVQGEMKGVGAGVAFADATTTSTATATGISGEDGEDYILSGVGNSGGPGSLHVYATSESYAESFSVVVQAESKGVEIGGALALGTTTATATATGMEGGTGEDTLLNQGFTDVSAEATANTLAASVDIQASVKGVGAGIALIDTTTSTTANAIGISGGEDNGSIINNTSGTIKVRADSNTYAESFAVTVQGESTGLELGGALALGSTTATATAMGISGGKSGDEIHNYGMVDVKADATTNNLAVAVDVQGSVNGLGLGVAFSDVSSTATTEATGILSGEGNDTIHNSETGTLKAYAESDSYSEVFSVNVQGKGTGIMIGGALALAGSTAIAKATGMDGGAGKDNLINEGFTDVNATSTGNSLAVAVTVQGKVDGFGGQAALTDTSTSSTATTIGISGGDDRDTIINSVESTVKSHATAEAYAESVSVSVQGYGTGVTMAGSLARGVTTPTASAIGISGGEEDDILANYGLTDVKATTDSTSVAVAVRAVGVIEGISIGASLTDTSTSANATAIGVDAGLGNDSIYNTGTILADTDSTLRAASVSFDFGGVPIGISVGAALASASTNATGTAIGIDGGEGDDTIINSLDSLIDVDSTARATSTAVSISANVIGAAWTDTSATTLTQAIGISGGEGKNGIANIGAIDVDSHSTAKVANVSVNLIGATPVSGWTSSTANATGIDAGLGDDLIQNEGTITADATSTTDATGVAVQVAGYSNMDITTNAIANATGISGGDGVNTIFNTSTGSIGATATTYADATAVNINLLGYSKTDGTSTGVTTAIGIVGGKEADIIQNDGIITSTATSDINASSAAIQLVGYGESNAKGVSNTTIKGIDGIDGVNTLINIGAITGTAAAYANASSYDIQLAGGAKATAGTEATATAIGIAGGKEMDTIQNEGTINLTAESTLVSESRSYKIFGFGFADADSKALAITTGIDGGEGNNTMTNASTGSITVSSTASATATSMTANIGVAGSSASTTSYAHSTGIKSGDGEDIIYNHGNMNITTTSSTGAAGGDFSLVGLSFGDSLTEAIAEGIHAGGGRDTIVNTGSITVGSVRDNDHPMAYSEVASVSFSFFGISSATFGSKAQATGITAGGGDDTIFSSGTITVGDDDWMAKGRGYGFSGNFFEFFSLTSVGATAETIATGIDGGDGNDTLLNDIGGVLTVTATSYAEAEGSGDTTFGSPAAFASSTSKATAVGMNGGEGDDAIENKGTIAVVAKTWANPYADAFAGWGSPSADTSAIATATAVGVDLGKDQNIFRSDGRIMVDSAAYATPYSKSDSNLSDTSAEASSTSVAFATGITAGAGYDYFENQGEIIVTATASTADPSGVIPAKAITDENATIGSETFPGIKATAMATGITAGDGENWIDNDGSIKITANAVASGWAYAESDLYDTETAIWGSVMATAIGLSSGNGNNTILNNENLQVTANSSAILSSTSDSIDDADASGGGVISAKAWGIKAGGSDTVAINAGILDVDVNTVASGSLRADSGGDGYGTAIFKISSSADVIGIAVDQGGAVWNQDQAQMTVDAKVMINTTANGDEFGTMGSAKENPGVVAVTEAIGVSSGDGENQIINEGSISVNAEGNIDVGTRSVSTTRSTHTNAWAKTQSTAIGLAVGKGESSITNAGELEVNATSTSILNDPDSWSGTYWRSDSWYNADAKTGVYAFSYANGIEASADNTDNPGNTVLTNSGTINVTAAATAEGNSRGDSGDGDGNATTYAEASADASGFVVGSGNKLVSIENSGTSEVKSVIDTFAYAHGDDNSYAYAKSFGYAYGMKIGDNNELVSIMNSGTLKVESTATAYVADDEPTMNSESFVVTYGIKISNSNSEITNLGVLEVLSKATAKCYTDEGPAVSIVSTASATGIGTGDGNNTVRNEGQITVKATAISDPLGGSPGSEVSATTQAIGIKTGNGNDTITNSGTITTSNRTEYWSWTANSWLITEGPGIAISSGGGNDTVILMNGSETNGHIDLGEGDDWLTLVGTLIVQGDVTGAAGIDTLMFDGVGNIDSTLIAFENTIKRGAGTYSVASLPTMQRIEIKEGVLEINDNYQFSDSGYFETYVNGDGSFGQFKVNGTTELAGDLNVLKGPGPYIDGTTYDIIEANAVNDTFSNVTLPEPNNFVSFEMNQSPTLVQIEVDVKDFTWLARNKVEWTVANYLDRILPSASGDLSNILAQIQNLSKSEFSTALSTLSSDSYDIYTRTTHSIAQQYTKSLQYRMNNIRSYQYAQVSNDEKPILLAFRGSDVGQLYNPERISQIHGKNGLWFDAFGQWGDQDEKDGYAGYDYSMKGVTLGFDHALTDKLMAGVSIGYSRADIDLNRHQGDGYIKNLFGSIYGSYFNKNLYIDGGLSYGRNWYENNRLIKIGSLQRKAYSDHDGDLFSAYLGAGYYFDIKKWLIGPFASLQYIYLDEESFSEKGANSLSLRMNDRQTDSLISELGLRLARVFNVKYGSLIPELSAAWLHDFNIDDRVITSSFAGSPGASFSIKGQDVERNGAILGAGISFIHKSGLSTSLKYKGEFREKYKSNTIMGELRFTF